jgi:putative acyltransferase
MPVRDGIEQLTLSTFANKFFLHPLGPYWYLHTLILCGIGYFIVWKRRNYSTISRLILLGFYFAGLSFVQLVAWDVSLYFFLGVVIRQSKLSFLQVFRPSWLAFIALLWLGCYPETFHKGSLGGLITVYLVISAALAVFPHLLPSIKRAALFLGRNSLALFLFSPIFTMVCKIFIPYLAFDSSRLLFLALSLPLCVLGALSICRVLDALHLSPWVLGREKALI